MRARAAVAACVLFGSLGLARGDDKPLERVELDRRVAKIVHAAATDGTLLYNAGKYEGSYRLYEGTLKAVAPLLDHRPKLVEFVKDRLTEADRQKLPENATLVLRKALDAVQADTQGALLVADVPKKLLWERLGGEKAARLVVHDFLAEAMKDPKVNFSRGKYKFDDKDVEKIEGHLVEFLAWGTGGPTYSPKYTGPDIKQVATTMAFTDAEFVAMFGHLMAALRKHKVPDAEIIELAEVLGRAKKELLMK